MDHPISSYIYNYKHIYCKNAVIEPVYSALFGHIATMVWNIFIWENRKKLNNSEIELCKMIMLDLSMLLNFSWNDLSTACLHLSFSCFFVSYRTCRTYVIKFA